jgi:thiol-disulfide isomerase/thioredoxin
MAGHFPTFSKHIVTMFLAVSLALRLPRPTPEMPLVPWLPESDIVSFLKQHERVVLGYSPSIALLPWLYYPVYRYSKDITFRLVNTSDSPPGCENLPCFKAYKKGSEVNIPPPGDSSIQFSNWCELLLTPQESKIQFPDQLRSILNLGKPVILDVRPDHITEEVPLYVVSQSAMKALNLSEDYGYFLYRPKDRQLLPFKNTAQTETPIKNGADNYTTKPFFAGYFINPSQNSTEVDLEVQILLSLSKKYSQKFDFVLFGPKEAQNILNIGKFAAISHPYIFAFRSENISAGRWFIQGPEALDINQIELWLDKIVDGTEEFSVLAAQLGSEGPEVRVREVNALNVEEAVINREKVTLLLSAATWCQHCRKFRPILETAAELLKDFPISFYWINTPNNDAPAVIPTHKGFPTLFIWPAGENFTVPVLFKAKQSVREVFDFIDGNRGIDVKLPELNETKMLELLTQYRKAAGI